MANTIANQNYTLNPIYQEKQRDSEAQSIPVNAKIGSKNCKVDKIMRGIGHALLGTALLASVIAVNALAGAGIGLAVAVFWPAVFVAPILIGAGVLATMPSSYKGLDEFGKAIENFVEA